MEGMNSNIRMDIIKQIEEKGKKIIFTDPEGEFLQDKIKKILKSK